MVTTDEFCAGNGLATTCLAETMQTLKPQWTCTMTPPGEISKRVDVTPSLALFEMA